MWLFRKEEKTNNEMWKWLYFMKHTKKQDKRDLRYFAEGHMKRRLIKSESEGRGKLRPATDFGMVQNIRN